MKNWKKYAAIIGVIALLAIFCLPMYFALKGDFSQKAFMASLFTVLFVAVMLIDGAGDCVDAYTSRHYAERGEAHGVSGRMRSHLWNIDHAAVERTAIPEAVLRTSQTTVAGLDGEGNATIPAGGGTGVIGGWPLAAHFV